MLEPYKEKQMTEKIRDFRKRNITFLDNLNKKLSMEMEWAKIQLKSTDEDTIVETAASWKELTEDGTEEEYYESLRNLIIYNVCADEIYTEDKIEDFQEAIKEKLKFLDYSWENNFEARYKNDKEKEILTAFDNFLNQEPSEIFKLGRKDNLSKKDSPIKSIMSKEPLDSSFDDLDSRVSSNGEDPSDEETSSNSVKTGFTGPIPVSKLRMKNFKKPQGISTKRWTSRGRGKRPSSPSSLSFALSTMDVSTMDSTFKSEIDENDNVSTFQANHWPDHASHALKAESNDEGGYQSVPTQLVSLRQASTFTRDTTPPHTLAENKSGIADSGIGDTWSTENNYGKRYSGFGSSALMLPKSKPDYPPNGKCSSKELMCDQLNFKEIYHEYDHIGFTFLKSVGQNQHPDIKCPMGCALSSKYFFLANTKAEPSTVMAFTYSGKLEKVIEGPRKFNEAAGMAVSKNDELFVNGGNTIMKFDKDLNHDPSFNSYSVEQTLSQFRSKTYGLFLINDGYDDIVCTVFGNSLLSFNMDGSFHKAGFQKCHKLTLLANQKQFENPI